MPERYADVMYLGHGPATGENCVLKLLSNELVLLAPAVAAPLMSEADTHTKREEGGGEEEKH